MPQYSNDDALYMTTHFGCTTADGYITDASIIRYKKKDDDGNDEEMSVEEAINENRYEAGDNVSISEDKKISVSFDFGTYK